MTTVAENMINDINELIKKYDTTAEMFHYALEHIRRKEHNNNILEVLEEQKALLGKCYCDTMNCDNAMFPPMRRYLKVINVIDGKGLIECLCFYEHPVYWFEYDDRDSTTTVSYKTGRFQFDSVTVEEMHSWEVGDPKMIEITPLDYEKAMGFYFQELIKLPWCTEHTRYGGVLPSDPKWCAK